MLKLSIILPTYNRLKYLQICLPFTIYQLADAGIDSYEIVIVDSGSTDGTREWVVSQPYSSRIVLVKQEGLFGATKAFQAGIERASGEYLIFRSDHSFSYFRPVVKGMELLARVPEIGMVYERAYVLGKKAMKDTWIGGALHSDEIMIVRRKDGWRLDERFVSYSWGIELAYRVFRSGKLIVGLREPTFSLNRVNVNEDEIHQKFDANSKSEKTSARWKDYFAFMEIVNDKPFAKKPSAIGLWIDQQLTNLIASRVVREIHRWMNNRGWLAIPPFALNLPPREQGLARNIIFGDRGIRVRDWLRARIAPYHVKLKPGVIEGDDFILPQCLHSDEKVCRLHD